MSGGIAYILDELGDFASRCNREMVTLEKLEDAEEIQGVRQLVEQHLASTGSQRAARILAGWPQFVTQFVKVLPQDYARVLKSLKKMEGLGLSGDDAIMAAFEENVKGGH